MAAAAVKEVNQQRDNNGINYVQNAMIRCGLSLNVDGTWFTKQLFPHLQEIVRKYPEEFEGITKDEDKTISDDSENTLSEDNATEQTVPAIVMNDAGDEDLLSIKRN
ncbi:hypothetical protein JG687_00009306 [Phytophthora cactorum]|uniref:Uncharacterized protein n=1 Tax=Phytophthora cactorum TaxID=29920 RepID=A0A329SDH8_9STRA|nr:hypothetical protein Pcac1_g4458 [Phytophthora cactorum]KAG2809501.1 hypothetical protein PC111_g16030 [Phytophthora cactorum]KAG2819755.1 hypothetical protein PC112_g12064 [Phytophthora cactorum]KAG2855297.1 hypothetical protein PC113_g12570 [Phytophthora cactorum]KAG2889972.1 hypothetical protein PC114_g17688 [Phytophthora cactorum]